MRIIFATLAITFCIFINAANGTQQNKFPNQTINANFNEALQDELLEMVEIDQNLRIQWVNASNAETEEVFRQAVINQDASAIDLAYLKDRVYMYAGKKQIFGTQFNKDFSFYPIEGAEHVNERRLAIGLPSIEEYLELIKEIYKNKINQL